MSSTSVMAWPLAASAQQPAMPAVGFLHDAQRPEFAVGFRYEHSSDGVWSVSLLLERKRQFAKPPLHSIRFDVRKLLTVHPRCALVGAALGIGTSQDVAAADLVVEGVEAVAGFCLRFRVQRLLQFLNTLRS